ncbi:MAG: nickel pincer cofactor biosynthesis protein LarC [Chitinispirillaceae bacterium]
MQRTVYFDLMSGAGGDMILASLIGLGVDVSYLREQFGKLGIGGLTVGTQKVKRHGIECCHLLLNWDEQHEYRHIHQIVEIINRGSFSDKVVDRCIAVLDRLAEAEAAVHGIEKEKVHFHEIGAVDTIVDILGTSLAMEQLGVESFQFSVVTDGQGTVTTEHGLMPVPVPATAELIRGLNFRSLEVSSELLTPTGAALLVVLGSQNTSGMNGKIVKTAYSCGDKDLEDHPNILRASLLEQEGGRGQDRVCQIESDMDHISGEVMGHVSELLLDKGALDVSFTPILMKKGRPGYRITLLCDCEQKEEMADLVMLHTRTLGLRYQIVDRFVACRFSSESAFMGETINRKECRIGTYTFSKPEYEDLSRLSRKHGIPLLELVEEYLRRAENQS